MTDDLGAELLVGKLKLPFATVRTTLNQIAACDPGWWALGKLYAYREQDAPFLHLDSDVFLWKRLAATVETASVCAQSPEMFWPGHDYGYYKLRQAEKVLRDASGWIPEEWLWYSAQSAPLEAMCCGVFGGTNLKFIQHYAEQAIRTIEDP